MAGTSEPRLTSLASVVKEASAAFARPTSPEAGTCIQSTCLANRRIASDGTQADAHQSYFDARMLVGHGTIHRQQVRITFVLRQYLSSVALCVHPCTSC